jgi:toxin ParE1/3/4
MSYIIKARARSDLKRHWRYIARDNVDAADRLLVAAERTFEFIAQNPEAGSQRAFRKAAGVRSSPIRGFPNYLVFYQLRTGVVVVLRVLHGMRHLPRFFARRVS